MGFIQEKIAKITGGGFGIVFCWVLSKFLFGVGLGMLLAAYFPHGAWVWAGWALIVVSLVAGLPVAKVAFTKPKAPREA